MPPIKIEYEITRDDLKAFQHYTLENSPLVKRWTKRNRLLYGAVILVMVALTSPWQSTIAMAGFVVAVGTFLILGWVFTRVVTRKVIEDQVSRETPEKGVLGRHRIRIDEHGLEESTAVGESRVKWTGIDRVERNPQAIFIYTTPTAAHMIPRRAFATSADADAFAESIDAYRAMLNIKHC